LNEQFQKLKPQAKVVASYLFQHLAKVLDDRISRTEGLNRGGANCGGALKKLLFAEGHQPRQTLWLQSEKMNEHFAELTGANDSLSTLRKKQSRAISQFLIALGVEPVGNSAANVKEGPTGRLRGAFTSRRQGKLLDYEVGLKRTLRFHTAGQLGLLSGCVSGESKEPMLRTKGNFVTNRKRERTQRDKTKSFVLLFPAVSVATTGLWLIFGL
jgi:hypothetical protein